MQSRPAALTLWLDDLESFLLTRRFEVIDLSALSKLPGIKVVSTIRNEVLREIDSLRGAQEVIARAARISLEAEMTKAESAEAGKLYPDIRLSKGLGESFIAGPQLKQRFDVSTSSVKSVVTAARDWSRTGMLKPITEEDLATLFQIYFKKSELLSECDTEFHDALRHACKPIVKYSAMLVRCDLADGKKRFAASSSAT